MKKILPYLLLALIVCGLYAPAVRNGFVWDDTALILRDPLIRSWRLIPEGFQHFLFTDATASDFYRPMQRLSYTLDYATAGFRPALYHLSSVVYHLLAACALFALARELLLSFRLEERIAHRAAFLAALAWAIHPLQTSAVVYISGRADSLAALFGFAGFYCALLHLRIPGSRRWSLLGAAAFLFLLSALSKEAGLIFLALWLALLLLQRNWKPALYAATAAIFVLVIYGSLRFPAEHIPAPAAPPMPLLVRPIVFFRAFAEYSGLLIFPRNLHMDRDVQTHPFGFSNASMAVAAERELQTLAGIILLGIFLYWLLRERKRDRSLFACLLFATICYLPISGIVTLNATVAEHWLYLPSAFLFLAGALVLARLLQNDKDRRFRALILPALVLWTVFLGVRTFLRIDDWKDQRTFLERTIADGGDSARMLINLGSLESSEGRFEEAKRHLRSALSKEPDQPLAILALATVAVRESDFKSAHELTQRAAQMSLVEAQAYELMAVLENKETGNANLMRMRLASHTGPPNWSIEKRYVNLLDQINGPEAAVREVTACLRTQWYRAETWQLAAELAAKAGQTAAAEEAWANAHRYDVWLGADSGRPSTR